MGAGGMMNRGIMQASPAMLAAMLNTRLPGDLTSLQSDNFAAGGPALLTARGWTLYKANAIAQAEVVSGWARLRINAGAASAAGTGVSSFWFNTTDGAAAEKEITGNVEMRTRVRIWDAALSGLPTLTQFRVAGIAVHNPDRSTTAYNYTHIGGGVTVIAGTPQYSVETKNTVNGVSTFPSVIVATATPWEMDLMVRKLATTVTTHYRIAPGSTPLSSNTGMIQHQSFTRTYPATCRYSLICYAQPAAHDIAIEYSEVQFATAA